MAAIFISYRRDDTQSATGRLNQTLEACFGADEIFRDLDEIEAGADFSVALLEAVHAARVVLVVIGRFWTDISDEGGNRRLSDPHDYVRLEIETALRHGALIIPVLVEGARMPRARDLPASIAALTLRQAHEISESRWEYDTDRLIARLDEHAGLAPLATWKRERSGGPRALEPLRSTIAKLPRDFLTLLHQPRKFLVERALAVHDGLARAVAFLVAAQLASAVLLLQEWPTRAPVLSFVLTVLVAGFVVVLGGSLPLSAAWRLAGAAGGYRRVLIVLTYQVSFVSLGYSVAALITLTALGMTQPTALNAFADDPTLGGLRAFLAALESTPPSAAWLLAQVVAMAIVTGLAMWLLITWSAYRRTFGRSRARSAVALLIFVAICAAPFLLVAMLAAAAGG